MLKSSKINRWRSIAIFFNFLLLLSIEYCNSAPIEEELINSYASQPSSSGAAAASNFLIKTLNPEVGNAAIFLFENRNDEQSLDTSNVSRRITAKSIFIAPSFTSQDTKTCPKGNTLDNKGNCIPDSLQIDADRQNQFVLNRLNARFKVNGSRRKPTSPAGPLQINIPISLSEKPNIETSTQEQIVENVNSSVPPSSQYEIPIVLPPSSTIVAAEKEPNHIVIYQISNDTKNTENSKKNDTITVVHVVPVEDLIKNINGTFDGVITISTSPEINITQSTIDENSYLAKSAGKEAILVSSDQIPLRNSENNDYFGSIPTVASLDHHTFADPAANTENTHVENFTEPEETYTSEISDPYSGSTENYYDDFTENEDEILKAGEAGMMVTAKKVQDNQSFDKTTEDDNLYKTTASILTTLPDGVITTDPHFQTDVEKFNDELTVSAVRVDEIDDASTTENLEDSSTLVTTVTTDASLEDTTALEENPVKPIEIYKEIKPEQDSLKIANDNSENVKKLNFYSTEIIQTSPAPTIKNYQVQENSDYPIKIVKAPAQTAEDIQDIISNFEYPNREKYHHEGPVERKPTKPIRFKDDSIYLKKEGFIPSDFRDQIAESSRIQQNFRPLSQNDELSYLNFPSNNDRDPNFIKFPSDEVNSIHNLEYKDHFRIRDDLNNLPSSVKTSTNNQNRQKSGSLQWRPSVPLNRNDNNHRTRQQNDQKLKTYKNNNQRQRQQNQQQQQQKPMLLKFWARMPLVRDLNFYPALVHGSNNNEPIGSNNRFTVLPGRRVGHNEETPAHEVDRLLMSRRLKV